MPKIENKVVVRFRDGRMVKGFTYDFSPHRAVFHITETQYAKEVIEVSNSLLKAVFFVKTFEGNKDHPSPDDFSLESVENIHGLKVRITFSDGEVMYGATNGYARERKGFFIFPSDKESNNERRGCSLLMTRQWRWKLGDENGPISPLIQFLPDLYP